MGGANGFVVWLLRSPLHRLLSGSVAVVRYQGRRSGRTFQTPVQYAEADGALVILAGRPRTKTWWRNFVEPRRLDVLVAGCWRELEGEAIDGAGRPDEARALLDTYRARFPKAVPADVDPADVVVVVARPV